MTKIDFKKTLNHLYNPKKKFEMVDVPDMHFIVVDGDGGPVGQAYHDSIDALYPMAYKLKFFSKVELDKDYVVPPLEGLWWADDMNTFITREKSAWKWTMMIMTPDWITPDMFSNAVEQVRKTKNPVALDKVRLESYHEGLSVQIMHIGSYNDETPILAELHNRYIPENGLIENGKHHEIYLGDPRRVAPEKLKTVLRQPVRLC